MINYPDNVLDSKTIRKKKIKGVGGERERERKEKRKNTDSFSAFICPAS